MLGGMFSFMKKTSRVRHNPESEGIYLSDLNADELDPEVAALYFPSSHRGPGGNVAKGISFPHRFERAFFFSSYLSAKPLRHHSQGLCIVLLIIIYLSERASATMS